VTDVVIRPITPDDDFAAQAELAQRAFGPASSPARAESWLGMARMRAGQGLFLGAFAGGRPVGSAMVHDQRQYWLGRPVGCGGVANVKVAPEYQGGGVGRRLVGELLNLMAERGYPLSALYPATMPIYRSLGWELAGGRHLMKVPVRSLRPLAGQDPALAGGEPAGSEQLRGAEPERLPVRLATPDDAAQVTGVIGRSHRIARDAGPLTWDEPYVRHWLGQPGVYGYLAGAGESAAGFAAYRWAEGNSALFVERVHGTTPAALRALWGVISSHGTMVSTVSALTGPDDPLWWLTRERDATLVKRSMWMLRVVDAPGAIAARGFRPGPAASAGLEIRDEVRPGNAGRWTLAVSDGAGTLTPNDGGPSPAHLILGPRGLAALYAGTPVASLRMAGLAEGGTPAGDATLDALFAASAFMVDDF
jgi:predicted acetyltransferase